VTEHLLNLADKVAIPQYNIYIAGMMLRQRQYIRSIKYLGMLSEHRATYLLEMELLTMEI
jgi:uncharacterized protein YjiS (DUF1127 family)